MSHKSHELVLLLDFFHKKSSSSLVDAQHPPRNEEMKKEAQSVSHHSRILASTIIEAFVTQEPHIVATWIRHRLTTFDRPNSRPSNEIDFRELQNQLEDVQRVRKIAHKQPFRKSKLDRHRPQILLLHAANASYKDIQSWLRRYKRLKISTSTIFRAIRRWSNE